VVTTELIRRIGDDYGVATVGDLMVGFKWIAGAMDEHGPERFILGSEESYGFLVGTHARDKDAGVASMLLAELAAAAKAAGQTVHQKLDALFLRYGCHAEKAFSVTMPGSAGMGRMQALMANFREHPPKQLAGMRVAAVRDFQAGTRTVAGAKSQPMTSPRGDLVMFDLEPAGNYVAVRPSGTEPKVKFYMFAYDPPAQDLAASKAALAARLDRMATDLRALADVG
jgi:phosphoglucomutase/phosphomannomutase